MSSSDSSEERTILKTLDVLINRLRIGWRFACMAGTDRSPQSVTRSRNCRRNACAFEVLETAKLNDPIILLQIEYLIVEEPDIYDTLLHEFSLYRLCAPSKLDVMFVLFPRGKQDPCIVCKSCYEYYLASVSKDARRLRFEPVYSYLLSQYILYLRKLRIFRGDIYIEAHSDQSEVDQLLEMMYPNVFSPSSDDD